MVSENAPMQVLTPTGNQAPLAAGSSISSLLSGQLGVFNQHTGLSVGAATSVDQLKDVFIAVGTGAADAAPLVNFQRSAGQYISAPRVKSYTFRGAIANLPKIVELTGFVARCETDYGIKIEFRNQKAYNRFGYNQFTKTFNFFTGCCADQCVGCGVGDGVELAVGLRDAINADPDGLVIAALFANSTTATVSATTGTASATVTVGSTLYTVPLVSGENATLTAARIVNVINADTTGLYRAGSSTSTLSIYPKTAPVGATATSLTVSNANGTGLAFTAVAGGSGTAVTGDGSAFRTANPGVTPGIRLTSVPTALSNYTGNINLGYNSSSATDLTVTGAYGFDCNGTITTTQALQYSEGLGSNLNYLIYEAGGFNGQPGPYRTSSITGLERGNFSPRVSDTAQFNIIDLMYDVKSVGGFFDYYGSAETIIALPCADATALAGIIALFDAIFTNFGPMAGDAAGVTCTGSKTSALTYATDGIESLA